MKKQEADAISYSIVEHWRDEELPLPNTHVRLAETISAALLKASDDAKRECNCQDCEMIRDMKEASDRLTNGETK